MEIFEATASKPIPYPDAQRAAAVEAIANYLRMLRAWMETRYAVAGNGNGTVIIAARNSYIYARLGGADEVIEAKLINLLEPQNDDALLVRREQPGGPGGWLVLDTLAATVTRRNCGGGTGFYIQFESNTLYKITDVSASGGTAVQVHQNYDEFNRWLAAPSADKIIWTLNNGLGGTDGAWIGYSGDGGASFAEVEPLDETFSGDDYVFDNWFSYWQFWFSDLSNSNCVAGANDLYHFRNPSRLHLWTTYDGGATWTDRIVAAEANGEDFITPIACPCHDGAQTYVIYGADFEPRTVYLKLYDSTGELGARWIGPASHGIDWATSGLPLRATVRYGDADHIYLITYSNNQLYTYSWGDDTLNDLGIPWGSNAVTRQILSTRAGTLLVMDSWTAAPHEYWLKVWRSTNAGVSWTEIDLTSLLPSSRDIEGVGYVDWWDYIAQDGNNSLYIYLEDGTVLFSTDDGATWTKSAVFAPTYDDVGKTQDVAGIG